MPRYLVKHYFCEWVWVFLEEISIWIGKLSKEDCYCQGRWALIPLRTWMEEGQIYSLLELEYPCSVFSVICTSWFPRLQTWIETDIKVPQVLGFWTSSETHTIRSPGSQTFKLRLNYISDFFSSHICRKQFVGLIGLHSCVSQFLWSISSYIFINRA